MFEFLSTKASSILQEKFGISKRQVEWEYSSEKGHGDLSSAVALQVAEEVGKAPKDIADILAKELNKEEGIERSEVAGPGYVNVWFKPQELLKQLNATREACTAKVKNSELPVIIDYAGPNIAKPLGVHHILSHIVGQAIVNLYRHTGVNVVGWSYPGDWGTQFGKLFIAFQKWGEGKKVKDCSINELLELYVRFHEELEKDSSLEDEAREAFKKLEQGDKEMRAFWKDVVEVSREDLAKLYERLSITLDEETGESFYEDKMEPIIKEGIDKGVFVEGKERALIVEFPEDQNIPPYMIRKSDGSTLYATRDLAMIRYRIDSYHPKAIYYVVDSAQSMHFKQLFETCKRLEWELPELEHTVFGRMRFADASMSTRKGTALKLEEVLDEAVRRADEVIKEHGDDIQAEDPAELSEMMGEGAVVYGILSQNRKMDIVFDWDRMLSFEGNSAPYLQYTHARAKSVLRKAGEEHVDVPSDVEVFTEKERSLANLLLKFTSVLIEAREARMPHILTNYLFALCQEYNSFYNVEPIIRAEEPQRTLRLSLTSLTTSVLKKGAEILTIRVPDRM